MLSDYGRQSEHKHKSNLYVDIALQKVQSYHIWDLLKFGGTQPSLPPYSYSTEHELYIIHTYIAYTLCITAYLLLDRLQE